MTTFEIQKGPQLECVEKKMCIWKFLQIFTTVFYGLMTLLSVVLWVNDTVVSVRKFSVIKVSCSLMTLLSFTFFKQVKVLALIQYWFQDTLS